MGDQQDLVEVVDADDPEDMETTEALPATQPEIHKHRFRLRGIRARQLAGASQRQPSTESYRVSIQTGSIVRPTKTIYGMSMLWPPCERSS
jgi:hypothetical protein